MNKKLLAVAIASALAAPFALADEGNVTISGNLAASVSSVELENGDRASDMNSNGSDLSISGWESLGNGLKAVFLLKSWINLTGTAEAPHNNGALLGQNKDAYLGLSGNFGTVALGAHGQPYKTATGGLELFGDTIGDARGGITNAGGAFHSGINNAVMWFLPNMNGFSGHLQYGTEDGVDNNANPWGAQFNYSNGPFYGTLAHADNDAGVEGTKIGVGFGFGDTKVNGIVENIDGGPFDGDTYTIGLAQKFGANTAKIQYADGEDASLWAVGLDHSLSKRTTLFAIYADGDDTNFDNGIEVGMAHSF